MPQFPVNREHTTANLSYVVAADGQICEGLTTDGCKDMAQEDEHYLLELMEEGGSKPPGTAESMRKQAFNARGLMKRCHFNLPKTEAEHVHADTSTERSAADNKHLKTRSSHHRSAGLYGNMDRTIGPNPLSSNRLMISTIPIQKGTSTHIP